jgi:hypothetical protein
MDKALFGASAQFQQQQISRRNAVQTNGGAAHQQSADFELPAKRSRLEDGRGEKTTSTFKKYKINNHLGIHKTILSALGLAKAVSRNRA